MKIKGIKIDEDVAKILNEQDNDNTSKYRVYSNGIKEGRPASGFKKVNESINEDYDEDDYEDDYKDISEEMHKERYVTYFETQEGRQKYTIYHVYTDSTDDSYNELCDKRDNQLGMYNSYKELKDALKERAEKIAKQYSWTVKSIENLGEDDEYYRERNKWESIKETFINEPNKKITVYFSNYVENGQFVSKPLDIIIGKYYARPGSKHIRKVTGYDSEYNNVWVAEYNPSYSKILRKKSQDHRDFENLASQEQIDFFNKVQQEQENKEQNIEHYAVMDKATGNVWTYKTREERDEKYKEVIDSYSGSDYIDVRKAYLSDDGDFVKWESYCNKNESIKEGFNKGDNL